MNIDLLINHSRFKRIGTPKKSLIYQFPCRSDAYFDFFNGYAKENYTLSPTSCLCSNAQDKPLSYVDRHGVEFHIVICENCGLIRAKRYYSNKNLSDFYKNFYRSIMSDGDDKYPSAEDLYDSQIKAGKSKAIIIKKQYGHINNRPTVLDLGGGAGGALEHFKLECDVVLADYFDPYLNYAKKQGIKTIKGGLKEVDFKPDIIILSHVIEHWGDFEAEIKNLIRIQKVNKTLNYIEFPGVDSLKLGRRDADILGDIHIPHVYYFTSYVIEDIMARFGFRKIYLDSEIRGLFLYTGIKKTKTNNYYGKVSKDLLASEKMRTKYSLLSFIRKLLPISIINTIRKVKSPRLQSIKQMNL
jgi:ubiquinone/menaquinone biosynthesis C-methylase UbiE